nr:MAG TPA: hypothetical protein [Caudoviricetes sp.]
MSSRPLSTGSTQFVPNLYPINNLKMMYDDIVN